MTQRYRIDSDSRSSAQVIDPVILWTSDDGNRRLAFLPHLHHNPNSSEECLSGQLRYQRKSSTDVFEDEESLQLSNLRNGEWTKYKLSSAATLSLFQTLRDMYQLYAQAGAPRHETTIIALDGNLTSEVDALGESHIGSLLNALLRRASELEAPESLIEILSEIGTQPLTNFRTAIGIAHLKAVIEEWETLSTTDEATWQTFFKENEWILAQAFSQPVILFRPSATVRPQTIENTERRIVDYVYTNSLTKNLALIEIKTPSTQLLAATPYRNGIYRPSANLVGSVSQISAYRHDVKQHASSLLRGEARIALRTDPQCVVIVGHTDQLDTQDKKNSFEQYRRELRNVQILTYDEVRVRAVGMLELLAFDPENENMD